MLSRSTGAVALACAALFTIGCGERDADPVEAPDQVPAFTVKPGDPGAASDRILYQVRLAAVPGSRAQGQALIEIVGGYLTATVHAAGLAPLHSTPQHIHVNPTCSPGGGILINLDANLTVAGEAPGVGANYPMTNNGGVINYYASRSLTDLLAAVNTYFGANLTSVEALLTWLDLDNRNAHIHVPVGPPFPAVNCGELERLN